MLTAATVLHCRLSVSTHLRQHVDSATWCRPVSPTRYTDTLKDRSITFSSVAAHVVVRVSLVPNLLRVNLYESLSPEEYSRLAKIIAVTKFGVNNEVTMLWQFGMKVGKVIV